MSEEKEPKPKPVPVLANSDIDYTGEKGTYSFLIFALDQSKKPMSEIPILVFFGKETQPRFRLSSNSHTAIEFPIKFSEAKLTVAIKVGNLKKEVFELDGHDQSSSISEEEKNMSWLNLTKNRISKTLKKLRSKK